MFENLSYLTLQQYWWAIISLLGALLVFLLFVQGGQTLIYTLGKNETERKLLINALGRKWEFTFTTLVTFGGAFFASFPLFYSTSFGGAYWVWMLILFAFVLQAVSYEYRTKSNNLLGAKTFETFLFLNGLLGSILLGVAVSTFFTGSQFSINFENIIQTNPKSLVISSWETPFHGLEAVWTIKNLAFIQNISLGFAIFFLSRTLAIQYFQHQIDNEIIFNQSKKHLKINSILFLIFFLFWIVRLLFIDGYAVNPETKMIFLEKNKYFHNFIQMPLVSVLFLTGVVLVLWSIFSNVFKKSTNGIFYGAIGTIMTVLSLFFLVGYNHTSFYPSNYDLQSSLTIENASSSKFTLVAMSYVSLLVPFVLAYITYAWYKMDATKISIEEIENDSHSY